MENFQIQSKLHQTTLPIEDIMSFFIVLETPENCFDLSLVKKSSCKDAI